MNLHLNPSLLARLRPALWLSCVLALAAGCGGGDNGSADGDAETFTAASGASVTVPEGALAAGIAIAIEASADGAPALPDGTVAVGDVHALTPHGTTFSAPVTVRLPFDAAKVPAGSTVGMLKTNAAQDGWEVVAGATAGTGTVSARFSSFSWALPVAVAAAPSGGISGTWTSLYTCDTSSGSGFSGEDTLVITQSGNNVSFTVSDGSNGVGTLSGDTVTWNSAGPGYTERGTWTILNADSMVKRSTYTNSPSIGGGGTCAGSMHKEP